MNTKKINCQIIFVILYFFNVFADAKIEYPIKLASDTPEKRQQIETAYENISNQVSYRYALEDRARTEAENQKKEYQEQTQGTFSETKPPNKPASRKTTKLWNNAKKAVDKYEKVTAELEREKFCKSSSGKICKRAFKNSYFKKENLIYDESNSGNKNECSNASFEFKMVDGSVQNMMMEFKLCFAINEQTKASVRVYLQSAYKQPFIGWSKFFVLYSYVYSSSNKAWIRTSDPSVSTEDVNYRYEAYLSLSWF